MNKSRRKDVQSYRDRARAKGGVIVYAMLTDPKAIEAWKDLQTTYGTNRDAIEAAIIDWAENMEQP